MLKHEETGLLTDSENLQVDLELPPNF